MFVKNEIRYLSEIKLKTNTRKHHSSDKSYGLSGTTVAAAKFACAFLSLSLSIIFLSLSSISLPSRSRRIAPSFTIPEIFLSSFPQKAILAWHPIRSGFYAPRRDPKGASYISLRETRRREPIRSVRPESYYRLLV